LLALPPLLLLLLLLLLLVLAVQVLTSQSLATFSLVDCCQSLLNKTLEVLPPYQLAALQQQLAATVAAGRHEASTPFPADWQLPGVRAAMRLARYSLARCGAVAALMTRLASIPEMFEMARATGLTLNQVGRPQQRPRQCAIAWQHSAALSSTPCWSDAGQ
jgi:hypothetical protein